MAKRYIIACASCELLTEVSRTDALTCSLRCRVRLHRHPELLDARRKIAKRSEISVFSILESSAVQILRPDFTDLLIAGKVTFDEIRGEVVAAFWDVVKKISLTEQTAVDTLRTHDGNGTKTDTSRTRVESTETGRRGGGGPEFDCEAGEGRARHKGIPGAVDPDDRQGGARSKCWS